MAGNLEKEQGSGNVPSLLFTLSFLVLMRFSKQIRAVASVSALIALLSAGTVAQAAPDYRSLAKSVYGDEECASILMSSDLGVGLSSVPPDVFSGVKPKNTACVLLRSFIRMPGAAIASREIVGVQGAELATPQTFAASKIPSLRAQNGETPATVHIASVSSSSEGTDTDAADESVDGVIWRIVYNDQSYDLSWEPVDVGVNPVTDRPYVTGANGRMWTPEWTKDYQTWGAKGKLRLFARLTQREIFSSRRSSMTG